MKQPVDTSTWSHATNLSWFDNRNFEDVVHTSDTKTKNKLKQNVLKSVVEANKLFHDKVDAWQYIRPYKNSFGLFLKAAIRLALSQQQDFELDFCDRYQLLTFFNYTFNSIEVDYVHQQVRRYLPMSIWINLSKARRDVELSKLPKRIRLAWNKLEEQDLKMSPELLKERTYERTFIFNYLKQFSDFLQSVALGPISSEDEMETEQTMTIQGDVALYCQRFLEFVIDLESQLPLRRFFHAILGYTNFIVRCQMSKFARHPTAEGQLFNQLVDLLQLYSKYEVDNISGEALSDIDVQRMHEKKIISLQKVFWTKYKHLQKYAIKPVKTIDTRSTLYNIITSFDSKEELYNFLKTVDLADDESMDEQDRDNPSFMASILINHFKRHDSQINKINSIPLFPNESVIWDTNLVPDQYYDYDYPLALPKLNLQFLTMSDYLLRNFLLFKYESTYEIRQDIEDGIKRSRCRWTPDGHFATGPKQRYALIIKHFSVIDVGKSKLGQRCPSVVKAKVVINMDYVRPEWKREWEQMRKHDTAFLVSFRKATDNDTLNWSDNTFPSKNLVKYVRGCEIEGLLDAEGAIIDEYNEAPKFDNNLRTFLVKLDCNQYEIDQRALVQNKTIVYDKFHLMIRRKPEKNNFKGVLETIRSLMNTEFVVPDWLEDLMIGFGDPSKASPANLRNSDEAITLDYFDTFLSYEHLAEVLQIMKPNYKISIEQTESVKAVPPFKVKFDDKIKEIIVIPYKIPTRGPYPQIAPKTNTIKFTPAQVEAITSGLQKGLTMVVGPPGTGKTDVAVQILSSLYHSNPDQRTLIVTHSNQALNQIFRKMIDLDVEGHHLLRMGHGEEDLDSSQDFSRVGRVKHVLKKRLEMLVLANRLAKSLGLESNQGLSCQSSEYFYNYHIEPRWREYEKLLESNQLTCSDVSDKFPFTNFFLDAPQPLFTGESVGKDVEVALGCFRYIKRIFILLHEFRPFEIFNNASDRSQYLLIREAKVIAMTCTHAGLRRKDLVEMNFQYDNILMEETAQILEIETTIPLLLQNPEHGINRLKRWIMIGDHNQLPPIIQSSAFQKFSNMEQSLFARFVRLGVPNIELDAQGRARPGLCDLYRWRYKNLQDLPIIQGNPDFKAANAGFQFDHQLIDVGDYNGVGESAPSPYFYQNRGEAEFVIKVYKFMRLIGYPADKITILTTYNGQKQLLRELLEKECADTHLGELSRVTTVDKFQGQQNDYILLSLVRTRTIGHVRDIRRLVVAMSRARLGLYVFARISLFAKSLELQPALKLLRRRPSKLHLVANEQYPTKRLITDHVTSTVVIDGPDQLKPEELGGSSGASSSESEEE